MVWQCKQIFLPFLFDLSTHPYYVLWSLLQLPYCRFTLTKEPCGFQAEQQDESHLETFIIPNHAFSVPYPSTYARTQKKKMRERSKARKVLELLVHILVSYVDILVSNNKGFIFSSTHSSFFLSNPVKSRIIGCNIYFISVQA